VGQGGGFIISGGCNFPYTAKPENLRALIDAVLKYGVYDTSIKPQPKETKPALAEIRAFKYPKMVTPWAVKRSELGGVQGDEDLIRQPWEMLESMAYIWLWQWVL
jgi:hypothetical protein